MIGVVAETFKLFTASVAVICTWNVPICAGFPDTTLIPSNVSPAGKPVTVTLTVSPAFPAVALIFREYATPATPSVNEFVRVGATGITACGT